MDESKDLTFKEKYNEPNLTWQEKAVLISLYHTVMLMKYPTWTLMDTAVHFDVSIGLVSENIRLGRFIDTKDYGPKLMKCETREKGLKIIERRKI
jgi:hypothetical protein